MCIHILGDGTIWEDAQRLFLPLYLGGLWQYSGDWLWYGGFEVVTAVIAVCFLVPCMIYLALLLLIFFNRQELERQWSTLDTCLAKAHLGLSLGIPYACPLLPHSLFQEGSLISEQGASSEHFQVWPKKANQTIKKTKGSTSEIKSLKVLQVPRIQLPISVFFFVFLCPLCFGRRLLREADTTWSLRR